MTAMSERMKSEMNEMKSRAEREKRKRTTTSIC